MSNGADELDRAWEDVEATLLAVFDGDARAHLGRMAGRADAARDAAARGVWLVAAAMSAVIACRFDEAASYAARAIACAPANLTAEHRLARAAGCMTDAMSGAGSVDALGRAALAAGESVDDSVRGALLVRYLLAEAALSSGAFETAEHLIAGAGLAPGQVTAPSAAADAPVDGAALTLQLLWARSSAFHGRVAQVRAIHDGIQTRAADVPGRAHLVFAAIGCYGAAVTGDRDRAAALAERVLVRARRDINYLSVGSCIYVGWALRALGQLQRAASLLGAAAGPELRYCKVWDRAFISEVLVEAALDRGDRFEASVIARRAGALQRHAVAAAALTRARSALARSDGLDARALRLAAAAVSLDELAGAVAEVPRGRLLEADALASTDPAQAAAILEAIARAADAEGNESLRRTAAGRWRNLQAKNPVASAGIAVMTTRQREVVALVAEGHGNNEIAQALFVSPRTVQTHVSDVLRIAGVRSRAQIAALAAEGRDGDLSTLTDRQCEIALLIAQGYRNAEIAARLGVSGKTVENHVSAILRRLGLSSRAGIARMAATPGG